MSTTITKRNSTLLPAASAAMILWASSGVAEMVQVADDSFIELAGMKRNQGASRSVRVDAVGKGRRGFARFDLSTLPFDVSGLDIDRATLRLFADQVTDGGTLLIHVVEEPWNEATLTAGNAPAFDPVVVSDVTIVETDQGSYVTADVTGVLRDWVDGVVANNGIALTPADGLNLMFDSKEDGGSSHPFEIEVAFIGQAAGGDADSKTVFLTSQTFTDNPDGAVGAPFAPPSVTGAHGICNELARAAGLPGAYRAWIGDANHDPERDFIKSMVPYVLPNGLQVADDYADLVDCTNPTCLDAPINVTERGTGAGALDILVWTNVSPKGVVISTDPDGVCAERRNADTNSVPDDVGRTNLTNMLWTGPPTGASCNEPAHLYCFEQ